MSKEIAIPPVITYSLRGAARDSDAYYAVIAAFADRWTPYAEDRLRLPIDAFRAFRSAHGLPDRSEAEYAFELLALGVLSRAHGVEAARAPKWLTRVRRGLVEAQARWPWAEAPLKTVRGWLNAVGQRRGDRSARADDIGRLIAWLRADGSDAQADRLAEWQRFFEAIGDCQTVGRCLAVAVDFERESLAALGSYTEHVERFLEREAPRYRRRYDSELVSRSRLEYHLGMLGSEVLSRAYRRRFLAARRKIVIVPPCLRARPDETCQAVETPLGAQCQGCTPSCRVHQITQLGKKRGFEVYLIPDELRGIGAEGARTAGSIGLVGIACALTNWGGGWQAEALGVPAQGVLLDYVGCRYHWHPTGIVTDTNIKKLAAVIGDPAKPSEEEPNA